MICISVYRENGLMVIAFLIFTKGLIAAHQTVNSGDKLVFQSTLGKLAIPMLYRLYARSLGYVARERVGRRLCVVVAE